ncbi:hypothetical protein EVAR_47064_1 [Eumeta japonica]|uniref:Uncharacterized protein n=1 Tax=Eumeta variegata TaxID=151549 RepID=A0A4C1WP57_EUMVA|nr:hypothetical protein EVAR_47064_1 [Eumeta japonica]
MENSTERENGNEDKTKIGIYLHKTEFGNKRRITIGIDSETNWHSEQNREQSQNGIAVRVVVEWVQITPTRTVPTMPAASPAFLKAAGIARMPVPKAAFRRCTSEPKDLMT